MTAPTQDRRAGQIPMRGVLLVVAAGSLIGWAGAIIGGYYLLRIYTEDPGQITETNTAATQVEASN